MARVQSGQRGLSMVAILEHQQQKPFALAHDCRAAPCSHASQRRLATGDFDVGSAAVRLCQVGPERAKLKAGKQRAGGYRGSVHKHLALVLMMAMALALPDFVAPTRPRNPEKGVDEISVRMKNERFL